MQLSTSSDLQHPKSLADWELRLRTYALQLLGTDSHQEQQALYELLSRLSSISHIHPQPVSLAVITSWLEGQIDETKTSTGFLRGQLTFCAMLPMRSIPFQVIALLGMNDGEFPKIDRQPAFDLIAQHTRLGDRSRRADDRYQFLEILLSARQQLILTYTGLSQQDNSPIPPSVVVSELLEVLTNSYQLDNIVVRHPLHAFSPRYFEQSHPQLFSYVANDFAIAQALAAVNPPSQAWWQGKIPLEAKELISLNDLFRFYNHPQRFFLQQQLGIFLPQIPLEEEECEPFAVEGLTAYAVQQYWIAELLKGKVLPLSKLQAQGVWPAGALGEVAWQRQQAEIAQFVQDIQAKDLGKAQLALNIDLTLGPYRLVGKLENLYAKGSLFFRYSKLKGKDFMAAWLHHLIINQQQAPTSTYLLSKDKSLVFRPELADSAILQNLITIFILGKQQPDAFFTEAAFTYLQQKNPELALNAVIKYLLDSLEKGYEPEIQQLLAQRDLNQLFNADFASLCQSLLLPAWSAAHAD
jgi:exodeoxyribonuclease V gamma subunit